MFPDKVNKHKSVIIKGISGFVKCFLLVPKIFAMNKLVGDRKKPFLLLCVFA